MRQKGCLITGTCSDLQDSLTAGEPQQFQVARMRRWLRDGLSIADRERAVLVRSVLHPSRHEHVPRREVKRADDRHVGDTSGLESFHETLPGSGELPAYVSRHQECAAFSTV